MKTKKISEIFEFLPKSKRKAGEGLVSGEYPFYTCSNDLSRYCKESDYEKDKLVFGTGGSASLHYANNDFSTSTDCYVLAPAKEDLKVKYIYYFLSKNIDILEQGFKGAGLKHISKEYLSNIKIPLPSLSKQERIVAILDKANEIKEKKQEANKKLDEFLKSTFLDLFGDPVSNSKFKKEKLADKLLYVQNGISRRRKISQNIGELVLRIKEIRENYIDYSNINRIPLEEKEKEKYK